MIFPNGPTCVCPPGACIGQQVAHCPESGSRHRYDYRTRTSWETVQGWTWTAHDPGDEDDDSAVQRYRITTWLHEGLS